jgi:hypothetical protein
MSRFLFLVTGLALGIGLGLLVAWGLAPVEYVDTSPSTLRFDFKDEYRYMIAAAYANSGDLPRAQARLATLADTDPVRALGAQAQRMLAENVSMEKIRVLANLSESLQSQAAVSAVATIPPPVSTPPTLATVEASDTPPADPPTALVETSTPEPILAPTLGETSTLLPTAIFTATPRATRTPTPTPGAPFALINQSTFCEISQPGLLQIFLVDGAFKPVAGVELIITWLGGEEHFFSGLKPEISHGYADYQMTETTEYALSLPAGGARVTGIKAPACVDPGGQAYPGGIRLEFKQP